MDRTVVVMKQKQVAITKWFQPNLVYQVKLQLRINYIYIYVFKNLAKVALGNEQFLLHLTGKHTGFSKMSHSMLPAGQPRDLWSILHGKEDQTMDCTHRCSECTHLR